MHRASRLSGQVRERSTSGSHRGPVLQRPRVRRTPGRAARRPAPRHRPAATADRDAAAAALQARLRKITTGQDSCILELEQLPADPADTAAAALRGRIRARFAELHAEREQLQAQLAILAAATPKAADTSLLDELPLAGDILPGLPDDLKARLLGAFDLQVLWNKTAGQATAHAEITEATLRALPALLNPDRDGYDDTSEHALTSQKPWRTCSKHL